MKHIILILLCFCFLMSYGQVQKYILKKGSNGYVTVIIAKPAGDSMPNDYIRGLIQTSFYRNRAGDTLMSIYCTNGVSSSTIAPYTIDTNFQNGDATNGNFPTADSLYRWTRRNLQKYVGN